MKMSRTRKNFRLRLICWIIFVSGRYFALVTSEQKSTLFHAQKHEIDCIFDELRILDKRYTLENSFCHFSPLHDRTNFEDSIDTEMYGAVLIMTWKFESWEL